MITLENRLPDGFCADTAEKVKIGSAFTAYGGSDDCLFWQQNGREVISLIDKAMVISGVTDAEELSEFIGVIAPHSIFASADTFTQLKLAPTQTAAVLSKYCAGGTDTLSDRLTSDKIYGLLNVPELELPEYPYFAVDFCRRLNKGCADYFALDGLCAAISFNFGDFALLNGIASRKKGYGKVALDGICEKNAGKTMFVCCKEEIKDFYIKSGFKELYKSGYRVTK